MPRLTDNGAAQPAGLVDLRNHLGEEGQTSTS